MKTKRRIGRKIISFLITVAMVVGMMSGMTVTALAEEQIVLMDVNAVAYKKVTVDNAHVVTIEDAECTDYTVVESSTEGAVWGENSTEKWYVVKDNVHISKVTNSQSVATDGQSILEEMLI